LEEKSLVPFPFTAPNAINLCSELPEGDFELELNSIHGILEEQKSTKNSNGAESAGTKNSVDPKQLFMPPQIALADLIEQEEDSVNKKFLNQLSKCKEALRKLTSNVMTNPDAISKVKKMN